MQKKSDFFKHLRTDTCPYPVSLQPDKANFCGRYRQTSGLYPFSVVNSPRGTCRVLVFAVLLKRKKNTVKQRGEEENEEEEEMDNL